MNVARAHGVCEEEGDHIPWADECKERARFEGDASLQQSLGRQHVIHISKLIATTFFVKVLNLWKTIVIGAYEY